MNLSLNQPSTRAAMNYQRSSWHRRISKPVLVWMVALVIVVIAHRWIAEARWLMVHIVTLGLITNSIVIWSQHFAEALLKTRLDDAFRRWQMARSLILNIGIVITITGIQLAMWPATLIGGTIVGLTMVWHAAVLIQQTRRAIAPRFVTTVRYYAAASILLTLGAVYGIALAWGFGDDWHTRILTAHVSANVLGFVGLTIIGTLLTLWPTMLRTQMPTNSVRDGYRALAAMCVGLALMQVGALLAISLLVALGAASYLVATLIVAALMVRAARVKPPHTFPTLAAGAGMLWLIGTLIALVVFAVQDRLGELTSLTVPFVGGFMAQVLLGAMSYLMPTVMGGGPRAVAAGLRELGRGATFRTVLANGGLILYLLPVGSWIKVFASLVAFLAAAAFLPLMIRSVRVQIAERRAQEAEREAVREGGAPTNPLTSQSTLADTLKATPAQHFQGAMAATAVLLLAVAGAVAIEPSSLGTQFAQGTSGLSAAEEIEPTGNTTTVTVEAVDMAFTPNNIEVPLGDRLVVEITNTDPTNVHDLVFPNGATSGRLSPGESATIDVGIIAGPMEAWCSIVGHRAMGMTLTVTPIGDIPTTTTTADATHGHTGTGSASDGLAASTGVDFMAPPSDHYETRSAVLDPAPEATTHYLTLDVTEMPTEVAPGVIQDAMLFNGRVMGPPIRAKIGDIIEVTLTNNGTMGHSVDFHAGTVSPDENMRTIAPGEELVYRFEAVRAGAWLYHCSTMPMSMHIAGGMYGAVIVDPIDLPEVDHEYYLVQSEVYVDDDGAIDIAAIDRDDPTAVIFNGHATQYVRDPLEAKVGERVRIWLVAAGPSHGTSFHVVGSQFDTVYKEGTYLLTPDEPSGGGAQALDLSAAQGGFVEMVFEEPGTYTFVNHSFVDMERGARGLITVTE